MKNEIFAWVQNDKKQIFFTHAAAKIMLCIANSLQGMQYSILLYSSKSMVTYSFCYVYISCRYILMLWNDFLEFLCTSSINVINAFTLPPILAASIIPLPLLKWTFCFVQNWYGNVILVTFCLFIHNIFTSMQDNMFC